MGTNPVDKLLTGWIGRLVRTTVSTFIATTVARWQNDPKYVALIPVIVALSKALRDKFPGKFEWLII